MRCIPVKTRFMLPPRDNLFALLDESLPRLRESDIVAITSKVVSIHQGRCIPEQDVPSRDALIMREAERYVPRRRVPHRYSILTIKAHTLIPSSGIDQSNANGHYILWPRHPMRAAREIRAHLAKKFRVRNLGIIITDSHSTLLRRGIMGVAIGFSGIAPLKDYRGTKDIFGRIMRVSIANVADALAACGVLAMGEGNERTPLVVIRGAKGITFTKKDHARSFFVDQREDIYAPLLKVFRKTRHHSPVRFRKPHA